MYMFHCRHLACVQMLLAEDADPFLVDRAHLRTALHCAAASWACCACCAAPSRVCAADAPSIMAVVIGSHILSSLNLMTRLAESNYNRGLVVLTDAKHPLICIATGVTGWLT